MTSPVLNNSKTVLLASSYQLIRESIADIVQKAGLEVIGQVGTVRELQGLALENTPDIFLLVGELPDGGTGAVEQLSQEFESSMIVVLHRPDASDEVLKTVQAGAKGYLSIDLSPDEFMKSLVMIAEGDVIISRDMSGKLTHDLSSIEGEAIPLEALSDREREVLSLVAHGASNKEIAGTLIITENTVKVHLRNIFDKLDLRNRQQAAAFAVQEGLVEDVTLEDDSTRD